ncbi:MAG: hopanoid biosynthesis associated radical protein HpnJ, partial [Pseudomonadota bacterium]
KYGVESGDQDILDEIDKRQNLEKNVAMIKLTKTLGIKVHLTFTFGLPSDTAETIEKTIALACSLPADTVQFSIATPFPGTEMYRLYDEKGWLVSKNWDDYNGSKVAVSRNENFTAAELENYITEAYRRFDISQVERNLDADKAKAALRETFGDNSNQLIAVFQTSRTPLTRWLINQLSEAGKTVHLFTPVRFAQEFSAFLPAEQIHSFDNTSHFKHPLHADWINQFAQQQKFSGVVIPYTHENRQGYGEAETLARLFKTNKVLGVTQKGSIFTPKDYA